MKKTLFSLGLMLSFSSFAMPCDYPQELAYHCQSPELDVCVSRTEIEGIPYRFQIIHADSRRGEMTFLRRANLKESSRSLSVKYTEKLLLITLRSFNFKLDKKRMTATIKARDFDLGIGDGPSIDQSIPQTKLSCVKVND